MITKNPMQLKAFIKKKACEKNITSTEQLTILEKPLTYAGVFLSKEGQQFKLDEKVNKYYFGNDSK